MSDIMDKLHILEAAIFTAGEPVAIERLIQLFPEEDNLSPKAIKSLLDQLAMSMEKRGVELVQVASGYRFQAKQALAPWLQRLSAEKPARYTRAFLETLALIAYKQPVTRGEIEEVRGVVVSSQIIKQLFEREWIKVVGHKEVPGRPAMFGTTKQFLDYFGLQKLAELPTLQAVMNLEDVEHKLCEQLTLEMPQELDVDEIIDDMLVTA